jgi:hypothetical protein
MQLVDELASFPISLSPPVDDGHLRQQLSLNFILYPFDSPPLSPSCVGLTRDGATMRLLSRLVPNMN